MFGKFPENDYLCITKKDIGIMEEKKTTDKFGTEVKVGDRVCFSLSMRKDQKPIVRATVTDILRYNDDYDWIVVEYLDSSDVDWARRENKLPGKVINYRTVKCY